VLRNAKISPLGLNEDLHVIASVLYSRGNATDWSILLLDRNRR
jgi:hypothetical protein